MSDRSLCRQFVLSSSMLMGAVFGYSRRAYSACANVGGSNWECSGASTAQTISGANAHVTALSGFRITTVSSNALTITGAGDLSYTDTNFSPFTATNGNGLNMTTTAGVPGSITVNTNGNITALNYGIRGRNQGTGALSITTNGDVVSTGTTAVSRGIVAINFGTDLSVTTGAGSSVSGARYGILSRNYGTGSTTVTANGDVTAAGTTGTDFALLARGNANVTVTTAAGTIVSSQETGIFAQSDGNGAVDITVAGDVTGSNARGIYARSGTGGSIAITVNAGSHVTSNGTGANSFAIDTSSLVVSPTTLTVAGTLNGGAAGAVRFHGSGNRLELDPTAVINGNVLGGGSDTLALGGTGTASFNVAAIGSSLQYQGFGTFLKEGSSHWTLTGTNSLISSFSVNGGLLEVDGDMPNASFTVNSGALQLGNGGTSGSIGGNVSNNGIFAINRSDSYTFGGIVSGTGAFQQLGSGTTIFTGTNTYTGGTTVSAGTLQLGNGGTSGSIAGDVTDNGILAFNRSDNYTFGGSISGSGAVEQNGSGTLILNGHSSYTGPTLVNSGILDVTGELASSVLVNSGARLMGSGTIGGLGVASSGVVAPGNSIGTLNVSGNVSFASGSTYEVEANASGVADRIVATGAASLNGNVVVLPQTGTYAFRTTYTILSAANGISGAFSGVRSNFAFLFPSLSYDANNVFLSLTQSTFFPSVARTANQMAVATALQQSSPDSPLFGSVIFQTTAGAQQAFDALSGELHASARTSVVEDGYYARDAVLGRLRQTSFEDRFGPFASFGSEGPAVAYGDLDPSSSKDLAYADTGRRVFRADSIPSLANASTSWDIAWWAQGVGAWGALHGDGNAAGMSRRLSGFFSGVDGRLGDRWRAGVAVGYTNSRTSIDVRASSADVDSAYLGVYSGFGVGAWKIRSGALLSFSTIGSARAISYPGFLEQATGRYGALSSQLFGEIGYGLNLADVLVEPFAGWSWIHLHANGFDEVGGVAALSGSSREEDVGYSAIGARASAVIALSNGMALKPSASLAWQHGFGQLKPEDDLRFRSTGAGFDVAGLALARDAALVQTALDLCTSANAVIGVSYRGNLSTSAQDHSVEGHIKIQF
ncbi:MULTISPECIES: autotransporter domain-containing protein [unclassified Bradyrhizobium]|uniref:autotransporter outer membrane beta-barrel domain-containing protein n=1 Tax=unclassified Bradyrhizobium TaxID=2631580 RepID=UPI002916C879|nr:MULTISPECIES: autotransporter domain-containing protein [unclassified Bradyrhizobium]